MIADSTDGLWAPRGQTARWLVLIAMVVNLVASLALALVLRDATAAGGEVEARIAFIDAHRFAVSAFWTVWIPASLGLGVVLYTVGRSLVPQRGLAELTLFLYLLGAVPDISNNLIGAAILPTIAAQWQVADPGLRAALEVDFALWDRFSVVLTGGLGNFFYALAGFVLTVRTSRTPGFPRGLVILGWVLWAATLGIVVATIADSTPGLIGTVAVTMSVFCVWCTGVALGWLGADVEAS